MALVVWSGCGSGGGGTGCGEVVVLDLVAEVVEHYGVVVVVMVFVCGDVFVAVVMAWLW